MNGRARSRDGTPALARQEAYSDLLLEAEDVAGKAVDRLRRLRAEFPDAVPKAALLALERSQVDPAAERRAAVRLGGGPARVAVRTGLPPAACAAARVVDRSANGLALWLGCPVAVGAVVSVRLPGPGGRPTWFPAEVRYCREDGDGWAAGCEFVAGRPRV